MPPTIRTSSLLIHQPNRRLNLIKLRHSKQGLATLTVAGLDTTATWVVFHPFADGGFAKVEEGVGDGDIL